MSSWLPQEDVDIDIDVDSGSDAFGNGDMLREQRTIGAMHMEIVEYLKTVPPPLQATYTDLQRELGIDLSDVRNAAVLDLLLSNRVVEVERRSDNDLSSGARATDASGRIMMLFRYRAKHDVTDRWSLLREVDRVATGVALKDLTAPMCYPQVVEDVQTMVLRGEIIAYSNKEFDLVLYPRGPPFIVQLSGDVLATAGQDVVRTTADLSHEVRRGDAVRIGSHNWDWYRVSCHGSAGQDLQRQRAPCSVTSDRDIDTLGRNVYRQAFNSASLPLDGDYDSTNAAEMITRATSEGASDPTMHGTLSTSSHGAAVISTKAYRHGVTNDIRELWTATADSLQAFQTADDSAALHLREVLARHNLIAKLDVRNISHTGQSGRTNKNKKELAKEKRKRKVVAKASTFNSHLKGGALEAALREDMQDL
jgi:hypothetical protein